MAAIRVINPKSEVARSSAALSVNISGAKGLQDVLKSNLGPKGTMKMLVSGSGDIKITKDGNVLLHEMQIQHPTASLIAKACTAQNEATGDGTTSTVLLIGELLKQAEIYVTDGVHPRVLADGFDISKKICLEVLDKMVLPYNDVDRNILTSVAQTALRTKTHPKIADKLADICVDAVLAIRFENKPIDLHMVEIMEMMHRSEEETSLIHGLVLDHGARHPDMPRHVKDAYILTLNVSLEYEKTTVNSAFFYKSAAERNKLVESERKFISERVQKIIDLKKKVCPDKSKSFVVINQQGIDPNSLDMLAREGIVALRRAKRRNMERITLACGGIPMNSVENLTPECLGFAGSVHEYVLGEDKYTFIEDVKNPKSVTILLKGSAKHTLIQLKDAVYDGLRAVKNTISDKQLVPGAGAFEIAAYAALVEHVPKITGKAQLGVQAYANALLVIPKTLASNAGFDPQDTIVKLNHEYGTGKVPVGVDLKSGEPFIAADHGIFDNYCVKRQLINSCTSIACNLLLVDEIMKAGLSSLKDDEH